MLIVISSKNGLLVGTSFQFQIIKKTNNYLIGVSNNHKILLTGNIKDLKIGMIIDGEGQFKQWNQFTSGTFNEQHYFNSLNVFQKFQISSFKITGLNNNIYYSIRAFIDSQSLTFQKYVTLILLGIHNDLNQDIYNILKEIGILHLFVISGFHIGLFFVVFDRFFRFCKLPNYFSDGITIIIILLYLFLLNFPIAATRAFVFICLNRLNFYFFKQKYNQLTLLSLTALFFIIYNPYVIFSLSFILTFLGTFFVLLSSKIKIKKKWLKILLPYLITYLGMFLIISSLNNYFSLFGVIFGIILTPVISFYYLVTILFFPTPIILENLYYLLDFILFAFAKANILISFQTISFKWLASYYIIYTVCILYGAMRTT